jgi:hypothetical protein
MTVGDLLERCAELHLKGLEARRFFRPLEMQRSSVMPGEQRLSRHQSDLLRRYGSRFQEFHAFNAPLELMMKASRSTLGQARITSQLPGLYIAQAQIADLPQALQDDLPLPDLLRDIRKPGKVDIYGANVWMGTPPTFTPLHKDPNPNLFVQMAGKKKVRLLEPVKGKKVFDDVQRMVGASASAQMRGAEMMQGPERLALRDAVWGENADAHEVTLGPGDALFIPEKWWHSIKSAGVDFNASVNWWFR